MRQPTWRCGVNKPEGRLSARTLRGFRAAVPALRLAVAVGLMALLFHLVPWSRIAEHLRGVRLSLMAAAFFITLAGMVVSSLKLWVLVRTAAPSSSFCGALRAYYVGAFFNNFMPTSVGGDLFKINEMRVQGLDLRHAAASVVVERALGVMVVVALGVAVSLCWGGLFEALHLKALRWPMAAGCVGFFLLLLVSYALWRNVLKPLLKARRDGRIFGRIYRVVESFYVFRNSLRALVWAAVLSLVFYALLTTNMVVVVSAVGGSLSVAEAAGVIPLLRLPELLPISPGALGVREGLTAYCLGRLIASPAKAAAVALLMRLLIWIHSAVGGCLYAVGHKAEAPARDSQ